VNSTVVRTGYFRLATALAQLNRSSEVCYSHKRMLTGSHDSLALPMCMRECSYIYIHTCMHIYVRRNSMDASTSFCVSGSTSYINWFALGSRCFRTCAIAGRQSVMFTGNPTLIRLKKQCKKAVAGSITSEPRVASHSVTGKHSARMRQYTTPLMATAQGYTMTKST
jgi:hypothetical protein